MARIRICDYCNETLDRNVTGGSMIRQTRTVTESTQTPASPPIESVLAFDITIHCDEEAIDEFNTLDLCTTCCNTLIAHYLLKA